MSAVNAYRAANRLQEEFHARALTMLSQVNAIAAALEFQVTRKQGATVFDVNMNTNYGDDQERRAGLISGYEVVARSLISRWAATFNNNYMLQRTDAAQRSNDTQPSHDSDRLRLPANRASKTILRKRCISPFTSASSSTSDTSNVDFDNFLISD